MATPAMVMPWISIATPMASGVIAISEPLPKAPRAISISTKPPTNKVVAAAAKYTVAEVNEISEVGDIDPNLVGTPGIYVQAVVQGYPFEAHVELFNKRWESINALKKK